MSEEGAARRTSEAVSAASMGEANREEGVSEEGAARRTSEAISAACVFRVSSVRECFRRRVCGTNHRFVERLVGKYSAAFSECTCRDTAN